MSNPPFRFETLLDFARQREEQQTLELAAYSSDERRLRETVASLQEQQEQQTRALAEQASAGLFDPDEYRSARAYLDRILEEIEQQSAALDEASQRVVESRDRLLEVLKEKRSLERLRERDDAAAAVEESRREAGRADDQNTARYARRAGKGAA